MAPRALREVAKSKKRAARRAQAGHQGSCLTLAPGTLWLKGYIRQLQAISSAESHCDSPASRPPHGKKKPVGPGTVSRLVKGSDPHPKGATQNSWGPLFIQELEGRQQQANKHNAGCPAPSCTAGCRLCKSYPFWTTQLRRAGSPVLPHPPCDTPSAPKTPIRRSRCSAG